MVIVRYGVDSKSDWKDSEVVKKALSGVRCVVLWSEAIIRVTRGKT